MGGAMVPEALLEKLEPMLYHMILIISTLS